MKTLIQFGLMLTAVVLVTSCGKKEDEPIKVEEPVVEEPVVEEPQGFFSSIKDKAVVIKDKSVETAEGVKDKAVDIKDVAVEKASDLKDTAGEALGDVGESVKEFGTSTSEAIRKKLPGSDD